MSNIQTAKNFLAGKTLTALATLNERGVPNNSVVYYQFKNEKLYFITEKNSQKAKNIEHKNAVALVIVNESTLETLQIEGQAVQLTDLDKRVAIATQIYKSIPEQENSKTWPAIKLHPHELEAFEVNVERFKYSHFTETAQVITGSAEEWTSES